MHQAPREDTGPLMRIADVARSLGVSSSTVRNWEKRGTFVAGRDSAGHRRYSARDLAELRDIVARSQHGVKPEPAGRVASRQPALSESEELASQIRRGHVLRSLRERAGLSLREVSAEANIAISSLSALESGKKRGSFSVYERLCRVYGVTMADLVRDTAGDIWHGFIPSKGRSIIDVGDGRAVEYLSSGQSPIKAYFFHLADGATNKRAHAHGGHEFMFVIDGEVALQLNGSEDFTLREGDAMSFPSTSMHHYRASGATRLLWINVDERLPLGSSVAPADAPEEVSSQLD